VSDPVIFPQFSAEGLPITYVPNPYSADGKPIDSQWKEPVRVHTTGNIILSGLQVIDTIGVMEGDRVLVKDQINPAENGLYNASSGAWRRTNDMYLWEQFVGAVVAVEEGVTTNDTVWICQSPAAGTPDVTPNNWIPVSAVSGTLGVFTPLRALVTDVIGNPAASSTTAQEIAYVSGVTSSVQQQFNALSNQASSAFSIAVDGTNAAAFAQADASTALSAANSAFGIAIIGTNTGSAAYSYAAQAYALAQIGTNTGTAALAAAATAQSTADTAYFIAQIGTNTGSAAYSVAESAYLIAEIGTNTGSAAYSVAQAAFSIAQIGTNTGTAALSAAATAQSTADSAFSIASIGTNTGSTAYSVAESAWALAQIGTNTGTAAYSLAQTGSNIAYDAYAIAVTGTNIGSLAYGLATSIGNKYVRTTRFASTGSTTGAVALPPNSTVVLDDFGGGVDAVITTISAGYPTFSHAFTAAGDIVTTSFDAGGNYTLSGAPSAYPVALIYRVRQTLSDFDSTSGDIIGDYDVESIDAIIGTPNQVYVNGSTSVQFGSVTLSLPQDIAPTSTPTFAGLTSTGSVYSPNIDQMTQVAYSGSNVAWAAYEIAQAGTAPISLTQLTDVSLSGPTAQQVLTYTGSYWTNDDVPIVISPSSFNLYLDDTASGTAGYNTLKTISAGPEVLDAISVTSNNPTPIESYLSNFVDVTVLPAGIWGFENYVSATSAGRSVVVTTDVYRRSIAGVETYLFSGTTDVFTPVATPVRVIATSSTGSFAVSLTDKLVAKYWFIKSVGGNATFTLYHNGSNHSSYIQTPLGLVHNQLSGLQGGGANEFYHVTLNQNDALVGDGGTPSAANPYSTHQTVAAVQNTADSAFSIAQIGTNTGTAAYNLALANSAVYGVSTFTAGTTLPASPGRRVWLGNTSGGQAVFALPSATNWVGYVVHVKKVSTDGNAVIVRSATGTATIDGVLDQSFTTPYMSLQLTTDGTNWYIL
jgi:hypothetical protein